jgi:colanic acid/amylovoran biosynthesis glycosyltransferase
VPELVEDGVNGYLVPYKNAEALAEKLTYLLEEKYIAEKMGKNGQELVRRRYSFDKTTKQHEEIYEKLLSGRHHWKRGA